MPSEVYIKSFILSSHTTRFIAIFRGATSEFDVVYSLIDFDPATHIVGASTGSPDNI